MTPEELNRAIEFLVQWQARMAAKQEETADKQEAHEAWTKDITARLARVSEQTVRLIDHQSQRMDRMDKLHEKFSRQFEEMLRLLNRIIDRLPPLPPNLN